MSGILMILPGRVKQPVPVYRESNLNLYFSIFPGNSTNVFTKKTRLPGLERRVSVQLSQ
jgi:hypothetical protein